MTVDLFGDVQRAPLAHQTRNAGDSSTDEWLTPPSLIAALGPFDLDPCSPGARRPWDTAGLRQEWSGRVWLNPPYSTATRWLARLAEHGHGTALMFARTETGLWFDHVWPKASGLLFLRGRLNFHRVSGERAKANSGAPSVLIAYGQRDAEVLARLPLPGAFVALGGAKR